MGISVSSFNTQIDELKEVVYKIKDTVSRIETNQEFDRKDFSEFENRLGKLEVEFKQLRDQIMELPKRTSEKITNAVDDMRLESQDLKEVILEKTNQVKAEVPKKKHWYFLWIR